MRLNETFARQVAYWRRQREWTAEQLAARCREAGAAKFSEAKINNIETRRARISIDEMAVLAFALAVPVVEMLAPRGRVDSVEIVPGVAVHPITAHHWLTGQAYRDAWAYADDVVPGLDRTTYVKTTRWAQLAWDDFERSYSNARHAKNNLDQYSAERDNDPNMVVAYRDNYHGALKDLDRMVEQMQRANIPAPEIEQPYLDDMLRRPWETPSVSVITDQVGGSPLGPVTSGKVAGRARSKDGDVGQR